ncbi:MAG TPA: hypothetical protein VIM11_04545 [Tepidisphaeraceae bacterium]
MKCEICGNRAVVHVSEIANGQTTERHFCPDCGTKVLGFPIDTPALLARMDELLKHAEARTHPSWESLAGEHRQKMLNSREECVKGLSGPSPQIRNVSWQMLLKRWKTDVDVLPECMDAIRRDADVEVRVRAVYYLAAHCRQFPDPRASAFFAEVALASDTPIRMRVASYFGLLRVHGLPISRELRLNVQQSALLPYPIDWGFVRRFDPAH